MKSSDKDKELTQVQTRNNKSLCSFNMDPQTIHNLEKAHEWTEQILNLKVSHGVIFRRALWLYRLYFLDCDPVIPR